MPAEDPTARARRVWDAYAPRYDNAIRLLERLQFGGGRAWVCSRATGDVLEVAVGTGLNLPFYPRGARVTGIDLSAQMLAVAGGRARELGHDVQLREADAERLPFPDESFDTVVCTLGLCAVPDEHRAIAEMHRVLRPGGRVLLLDHVGSNWWPVWAGQRLLEAITVRQAGEHQTRRPLPVLETAGFEIEESERSKAGTVERVAARKPGG